MTRSIPLNDGWEFAREPAEAFFLGGEAETESVRLPHTGTLLPYNYSEELDYQYLSGYRKKLPLPPLDGGRRLFVHFDGAAQRSRLLFNGETLLTHRCGYTGFTAELTKYAREGENLLALELDSRESLDQPPFGNEIDYLTYQGIYRGCRLTLTGPSFLADLFVHTHGETAYAVLAEAGAGTDVLLRVTDGEGNVLREVKQKLPEPSENTLPLPAGLPVGKEECRSRSLRLDCPGAKRWSTEEPNLYTLTAVLLDAAGEELDERSVRFGFRDAEFRTEGFFLNGEKLTLRGLDRHQSYPYVGYAMPDNVQKRDAEILRQELGLNVVRTSHYPQSQAFLDRCDELGLLVFTEIPGWQHIGGEDWKEQAVRNVDDMVWQDRSHPSVILWGVRINESPDDDAFYRRTNERAHALDPSRQTGGVRCIRHSHLLEDVYTYNDFIHRGDNQGLAEKSQVVDDLRAPYLVTEYNGHMFPTKPFDDEAHRLAHALRHAAVLDAMYSLDGVSGCIGWCAFDYNTHQNFGSGDRICYHGVMDMFRNPKLAAAVYASQQDLRPVLEISGSLDKGEWPASELSEVWAFTNADSVRLFRNGVFLREFFPDKERFPHLPHPPVRIDDFAGPELMEKEKLKSEAAEALHLLWAAQRRGEDTSVLLRTLKRKYGVTPERANELKNRYYSLISGGPTYRFEAMKKGLVTAQVTKEPVHSVSLQLLADRTTLREEGMWDAAEVRIRAVDQNGNGLPYAGDALCLEAEGAVALIGPACVPLRGGAAGVWVRTTGAKGEGVLRIRGFGPEREVRFTVE